MGEAEICSLKNEPGPRRGEVCRIILPEGKR